MVLKQLIVLASVVGLMSDLGAQGPSVADYPSIQAAIDANPGKVVQVPAGDYVINEKLRLRGDGVGLVGPGKIIQNNPDQPIIEIEQSSGVQLKDLQLTRASGQEETGFEAVLAIGTQDLVLENLRIVNNRTRSGAIVIRRSTGTRITHCVIRNYMRVSTDDRTSDDNWGYAFKCTDGTGISIGASQGTLIESNTIIETTFRPTQEIKEQYKLGQWVKKNATKGKLMSQAVWAQAYSENWQQGSGIVVTSPEESDMTRIANNHIENAAQGIDLHCDHAIVTGNVVVNSFMGMKAMHGSCHVLIAHNQFIKNTLWAIGLMPGVASHESNTDGGSIIQGNIISDFGDGDAVWIWGSERAPLRFDHGQEPNDPPLTDVIIEGNLIHSRGNPKYRFAVIVEGEPNAPRGLHFAQNLFPPGSEAVCNNASLLK